MDASRSMDGAALNDGHFRSGDGVRRRRFRGFSFICCTADETMLDSSTRETTSLLPENRQTQDAEKGRVDEPKIQTTKQRNVGGYRTMPFIFANEICEKLAVVGFSANMVTYLTQQLHLSSVKAANTLTNFGGTASLTPLLGAFLADTYVGRFWTITAASVIYQLGMILLTVSAAVPALRPPPCGKTTNNCLPAEDWQLWLLYLSLLFTALGAGGIRPCVVTFGADQFDETDPSSKKKLWSFFNVYYFCMGFSILLAVTVIVYIQDNVGWTVGFGVPAAAMAISIVIFLLGLPLYRHFQPTGSPLTRIAQVAVAAIRKRNIAVPADPAELHQDREKDLATSPSGILVHTDQLKFFDRAAVVTESDFSDTGRRPWRLCTVHQVEEFKTVLRMFPIWASGILLVTASSQQHTFSLLQARTMDRHLTSSFEIPAGSMSVFGIVSMLLWLGAYDRLLMPVARRLTGVERGITFLQRMGVGFAVSVTATLVAGFVEALRKRVAAEHGLLDAPRATVPMTVMWLVPQHALFGMAEAFMSVGHLEFFYDQSPESMRSTATALFWTAISAGSYVSTLLVSLVHRLTQPHDWLPSNLNRGKLDYFYWLITILQVVNLLYYLISARFYTYKPFVVAPASSNHPMNGEVKPEVEGDVVKSPEAARATPTGAAAFEAGRGGEA